MSAPLQQHTRHALRDLHARERMRLGWYRQLRGTQPQLRQLRATKAQNQALLLDLMRRRSIQPAWYARLFYYVGHAFGLLTGLLPGRYALQAERVLEQWILIRYRYYQRRLKMDAGMRSMIEAMQLQRLPHQEPGQDVLSQLDKSIAQLEEFLTPPHTGTPAQQG